VLWHAGAVCQRQQPIAVEANKKLQDISSALRSLLDMLADCIKQPDDKYSGDVAAMPIRVMKCNTQGWVTKGTTVEYEYEEARQGFGHWLAQVQSRSTGGEGGEFTVCCCSACQTAQCVLLQLLAAMSTSIYFASILKNSTIFKSGRAREQ
jgi:hypothetical protein